MRISEENIVGNIEKKAISQGELQVFRSIF
jgi:hypothetical protein